jgi:hypothetical protein
MFSNSVIITVKIVHCCAKVSQTHHSVNYFEPFHCYRTVFSIIFLPQYVICCSIHTVCCKHVLIHCPSRASDGLIGPASVSGLHQEPHPERSCLLVWSVDVCSEVTVFTFFAEWPIHHFKWAFLPSWEQQFIFCPRLLLAIWWSFLGLIFFLYQ